MKRASVLDYTYAVAKVRALEKFLIRQEVFAEAIGRSLNEALRLFVESGLYGDEILHIKNSAQLESALNQELIKLKKLVNDLILDKELLCLIELNDFAGAKRVLHNFKSGFLNNYFSVLIDTHNIKTLLRFRLTQEPKEKLAASLISGGYIEAKDLLELYEQEAAALINRLEYVHQGFRTVDYAFYLGEAIKSLMADNSFVALEKTINDFLTEMLKPAKYFTFGPEPVLAYYFAKVNEINLMRMVILAKLNDFPQSLVNERLSSVYA